ncbi:MAG: phenylalanine--tRNA ligase subunit beta [Bacteroidetes bacterium]|nr:phenylalanine--tRNA ligase subunit beta [Bacteroidota bacterium]
MKISYNWLTKYVNHQWPPQQVGNALTMSGLEVEHVDQIGLSLDGVIVGQILSVQSHPNADRLRLCEVTLGEPQSLQIVCGAPNVEVGQHVAVATVGTTLTLHGKSIKIKKAKIRGEISTGMICAEDELGLSDDHDGIMVLSDHSVIGEPLLDYLHRECDLTEDVCFDLSITPNRPDATCHIGVARDLAALRDVPLRLPDITPPSSTGDMDQHLDVEIHCPELCGRYTAMMVQNVTVAPSPPWLQRRLESVGLRSINNVVDITNFVMYECGQPLHAFNYDLISNKQIVVRSSVSGEEFITLDEKHHVLDSGVALICDGHQPIAIGGIMGGKNSEVDDSTTNILIESAWFDPSGTRRSAKSLGISTDASYRFERGVDAQLQPWAAMRAVQLINEIAGGSVVNGIIDIHPHPQPLPTLDLRLSRIHAILGIEITHRHVTQILVSLGFHVDEKTDGVLSCTVPSHRPDIFGEIDLIEEIARIHGYDQIPLHSHTPLQLPAPLARPSDQARDEVVSFLTGNGFREIYTNSLLPDDVASQFSQGVLGVEAPPVRTLNAVSSSMATLRPSLLPGMLSVMKHNVRHSQPVLRFYEFGHVFHQGSAQSTFLEHYSEYDALLIGISGPLNPSSWDTSSRMADFFDLKGDMSLLFDTLQLNPFEMQFHDQPTEITEYHITLATENLRCATIAKLADSIQDYYELPHPVFFADFNWTRLLELYDQKPPTAFTPISLYPIVERDLAISVEESQSVGPLLSTLQTVGKPLLKEVNVFDIYTGDQIPSGQKSIAFSLRFGADRTLTDKEIDRVMQKIVDVLSKQFNAILRS